MCGLVQKILNVMRTKKSESKKVFMAGMPEANQSGKVSMAGTEQAKERERKLRPEDIPCEWFSTDEGKKAFDAAAAAITEALHVAAAAYCEYLAAKAGGFFKVDDTLRVSYPAGVAHNGSPLPLEKVAVHEKTMCRFIGTQLAAIRAEAYRLSKPAKVATPTKKELINSQAALLERLAELEAKLAAAGVEL